MQPNERSGFSPTVTLSVTLEEAGNLQHVDPGEEEQRDEQVNTVTC